MTPDHPWMWYWGGMWFFPIIMLGVMIIFFLFFRRGGCRPPWWNSEEHFKEKSDTAIEILKKRYAKGEIPKDEFEEMKKVILND
jgi:putative membrane protein